MKLAAVALAALLCACSLPGLSALKAWSSGRERQPDFEELEERTPTPRELLTEGDRLRDTGNVSRAAWSYLKALRADPSERSARERIGYLHLAKGDAQSAQTTFEVVLSTDPSSVAATIGLGLAHLQLGRVTESRAALEKALVLQPRSAIAMLGMGMLCDWSSQHEEARGYYERARQLEPINQEIENNLGVSYLLSRDYPQAEVHLRRAIQLDPSNSVQYNNLGLVLGEQQRFGEALEAFRRASSESTAQNNVGYLCYLKGHYAAAVRHYELALAATPSDQRPIIRNLRRAQDDLDRSQASPDNTTPAPAPAP